MTGQGSPGTTGRPFQEDLIGANFNSVFFAIMGGVLWNIGNVLLVAAIAVAGMAVAFLIGGGIAWILGIIVYYILVLLAGQVPSTRPVLLWTGVVIIIVAIFLSGHAYKRIARVEQKPTTKGILLSAVAGIFIAFFLWFCCKISGREFYFRWNR